MTEEQGITENRNEQKGMPFAIVQGMPLTELPKDLYIPPDALEVFLEAFEGPLDLLLYLIKKQNINILDIPLVKITEQYMSYINLMETLQLELVGEYLLMAAMLAEIKSRMLLPRRVEEEEGEEDPRVELIRRLQEYERYKQAAEKLDELPRYGRDLFSVMVEFPGRKMTKSSPAVSIDSILRAFSEVLKRANMFSHHMIKREVLSVRERMIVVLERVSPDKFTDFLGMFTVEEGRAGVIVSLLAILQLVKDSLIQLVQNELNGPIYVKAVS